MSDVQGTDSLPERERAGARDPGPTSVLPGLSDAATPQAYTVDVVERTPHDTGAFTQGLLYSDGQLYEGTGRYGGSEARRVDVDTGEVLRSTPLAAQYFGEGIALSGDRLYQLTWREEKLFVYDRRSLDVLERVAYQGEGWGLTRDGDVFWRSDGSSTLHLHDPETFEVVGAVEVIDRGVPVERLNELEFVDGHILANVFTESWLAAIDPATGQVSGWVDASPLVAEVDPSDRNDVLNGVAVDQTSGRLWLTGKRWPSVFEVRLVPGGDLPPPGLQGS